MLVCRRLCEFAGRAFRAVWNDDDLHDSQRRTMVSVVRISGMFSPPGSACRAEPASPCRKAQKARRRTSLVVFRRLRRVRTHLGQLQMHSMITFSTDGL